MKAHVMRENVIRDTPVAGQMLERLFDQGVEVVVLERGGGMLGGYGPVDVDVTPDPRAVTSAELVKREAAEAFGPVRKIKPLEPMDAVLLREQRERFSAMHRRAQAAESREAGLMRRLKAAARILRDFVEVTS